MLIMVVQTIVTVAYIHHSEETGTEYVSFDHDVSVTVLQAGGNDAGRPSLDDVDCHQCCHCTGIFSFLINENIYTVLSGDKRFGYLLNLPSAFIAPHLRPPIL
ncbi:MAG: hypothetical protein L3J58_11290 [Emcibacter sp.]|nr:hypothetical protein [Emcibacter sp.]